MEPLLAIGAFCRDSSVQTVIQFHLVVVAASNITDTDPVSSNRIKLFRITGNCFAFPVVGDSSNLYIRVYLYFMSPAFLGATVYFQKVNIDYIVKT